MSNNFRKKLLPPNDGCEHRLALTHTHDRNEQKVWRCAAISNVCGSQTLRCTEHEEKTHSYNFGTFVNYYYFSWVFMRPPRVRRPCRRLRSAATYIVQVFVSIAMKRKNEKETERHHFECVSPSRSARTLFLRHTNFLITPFAATYMLWQINELRLKETKKEKETFRILFEHFSLARIASQSGNAW